MAWCAPSQPKETGSLLFFSVTNPGELPDDLCVIFLFLALSLNLSLHPQNGGHRGPHRQSESPYSRLDAEDLGILMRFVRFPWFYPMILRGHY